MDRVGDFVTGLIAASAASIVGLVGWVVRTIFTNQKMLRELRHEIDEREARRSAEMSKLDDVREQMKELRADVKTLFRSHGGNNG